jgi:hypothetical protein
VRDFDHIPFKWREKIPGKLRETEDSTREGETKGVGLL